MIVKAHELVLPGEERSVHFTSLLYLPEQEKLLVGTTDMKNDLLYTFDPCDHTFESCDFRRIADRFDVKIHRSLAMDADGSVIGATAGLHGVPERRSAKGGKIFRYHPEDGELEMIAQPVDRDYIQSILLDPQRRMIYGFTYPVGHFFRYSLETGGTQTDYIGSYPHLPAMDDDGGVWGTWGASNKLFRYDPDSEEITWHNVGIPRLVVSYLPGAAADNGQVDCMFNPGGGKIYMGSVSGGLFKLHPTDVNIEYLGKPLTGLRMAALTLSKDGRIHAVAGMEKGTRLIALDPQTDEISVLGAVVDAETGESPYISHHIVEGEKGVFYSGETDNPRRSGFLWETRPE